AGSGARRAGWLAALAGLGLFLASRAASIATTAINWDEFALLDRVARMARTGVPETGGRPGLAETLLLPIVSACSDEIATARTARWLWLGLTLCFLIGLFAMLREVLRGRPQRSHDALLGVALLALVPAFLEWSLQVRTDQLALAGGVWGGMLLLASQRRAPLALAAGILFGVGYLGSQKLLYAAALAGLLTAGRAFLDRDLRPGREALRATLCLAGFGLVFAAFRAAMGAAFDVPPSHPSQRMLTPYHVGRALDVFEFYRHSLGFSQYRAMLPTLWPHALLLAASAAAGLLAWRKGLASLPTLLLAFGVLALGAGIAAFHAGAFFYFWMTLGLFPAAAIALALEPIREALLPARARPLAAALLWAALLLPGAVTATRLLADTQGVQRESLGFIRRNFAADDAGFHPERALFCSPAEAPLPLYFSQTIFRDFVGPQAEANLAHLEQRFRGEPIKFLVQSFRLNQFPLELRRFWSENYQPYRASVFVAGRHLEGGRGATSGFELIVPGRYRWLPLDAPRSVRIDETLLGAGDVVALATGPHTAGFVEDATGGMLVLALEDPPGPAPLPFYKVY
ncbi:MAG: hypothetical protein ACHQ3O_02610, partial [Candidatus Limnocylindria bacterium]